MICKIVVALAAVAAVTAGSTIMASARHGGGMGHGGFGHMGGVGHSAFAHPGGFRGFAGARPFAFHRDRFAFRHQRFFFNRVGFFGATFPYAYDDNCYTRVWTRWGWRRMLVCY
jgi:hypothetical protein